MRSCIRHGDPFEVGGVPYRAVGSEFDAGGAVGRVVRARRRASYDLLSPSVGSAEFVALPAGVGRQVVRTPRLPR